MNAYVVNGTHVVIAPTPLHAEVRYKLHVDLKSFHPSIRTAEPADLAKLPTINNRKAA